MDQVEDSIMNIRNDDQAAQEHGFHLDRSNAANALLDVDHWSALAETNCSNNFLPRVHADGDPPTSTRPAPSTHCDQRPQTVSGFHPNFTAYRSHSSLSSHVIAALAKAPRLASSSPQIKPLTCDTQDADSSYGLDIKEIDPTLFGREQYANMCDDSLGWAEYVRRMLEEGKPENGCKRIAENGRM